MGAKSPTSSSFISQRAAAQDLSISKVTLWRLISRGNYPEPVAIPGTVLKPIVRKEHEAYKARLMDARKDSAKAAK